MSLILCMIFIAKSWLHYGTDSGFLTTNLDKTVLKS